MAYPTEMYYHSDVAGPPSQDEEEDPQGADRYSSTSPVFLSS